MYGFWPSNPPSTEPTYESIEVTFCSGNGCGCIYAGVCPNHGRGEHTHRLCATCYQPTRNAKDWTGKVACDVHWSDRQG